MMHLAAVFCRPKGVAPWHRQPTSAKPAMIAVITGPFPLELDVRGLEFFKKKKTAWTYVVKSGRGCTIRGGPLLSGSVAAQKRGVCGSRAMSTTGGPSNKVSPRESISPFVSYPLPAWFFTDSQREREKEKEVFLTFLFSLRDKKKRLQELAAGWLGREKKWVRGERRKTPHRGLSCSLSWPTQGGPGGESAFAGRARGYREPIPGRHTSGATPSAAKGRAPRTPPKCRFF